MAHFDFIRFCHDNGITTVQSGHKHCQPGWVQTPCPYCSGNPGFHLGFELAKSRLHCWRCGKHDILQWICDVLGIGRGAAKNLRDRYNLRPSDAQAALLGHQKDIPHDIVLPVGTGPLEARHRAYLEARGFDPEELVRTWGIQATGPVGPYKHRIVVPITLNGLLVSYQCRDITGKTDVKYKACPKDKELIHHKTLLYGEDRVHGDACVVVEGVTDVWKLGPGAVATFGIKYRPEQVQRLAAYNTVYVLFDHDEVAGIAESKRKAEQLCGALASLGVTVEEVRLNSGDPGDLPMDQARAIMHELLG